MPIFLTQLAIKWSFNFLPRTLSAFVLTGEIKPTKYCIFILFRLFRFSQVVQKLTFGEMKTRMVI